MGIVFSINVGLREMLGGGSSGISMLSIIRKRFSQKSPGFGFGNVNFPSNH